MGLIILYIMFGQFSCTYKTYDPKESIISNYTPPEETVTADDFVLDEEDSGAKALDDPFESEMPAFADNKIPTPAATPEMVDLTPTGEFATEEIEFDVSKLEENIVVPTSAYLVPSASNQPAVQQDRSEKIAIKTVMTSAPATGGGGQGVPSETVSNSNGVGGNLNIDGGGSGAVVISTGSGSMFAGHGGVAGMGKRLSENNAMSQWILNNQSELPPVVRQQLKYEPGKDVTAKSVAVYDVAAYNLYFLFRKDDNLLRVLVITGEEAMQFDLPQFDTKNWNVQNGYAVWSDIGTNDDLRYPLIVNVSPVSSITDREKTVMGIILEWLKVTNES